VVLAILVIFAVMWGPTILFGDAANDNEYNSLSFRAAAADAAWTQARRLLTTTTPLHSTDAEPPPLLRVCVHPEGETCSELSRALVLNDPGVRACPWE